jgi:hypothetical protein
MRGLKRLAALRRVTASAARPVVAVRARRNANCDTSCLSHGVPGLALSLPADARAAGVHRDARARSMCSPAAPTRQVRAALRRQCVAIAAEKR